MIGPPGLAGIKGLILARFSLGLELYRQSYHRIVGLSNNVLKFLWDDRVLGGVGYLVVGGLVFWGVSELPDCSFVG